MENRTNSYNLRVSPFSTIIIFVVLAIVGAALSTRLPIRLLPDTSRPGLTVNCSWRNSSKFIIEKEITTPLENGLSTISGLRKISSSSSNGSASISLEFDKTKNLAAARFEAQQIVRQIYPKLPKGASFPRVSGVGNANANNQFLMSYSISGNYPDEQLYNYAENTVKQKLTQIEGITNIYVSGYNPIAYYITYDFNYCNSLNISDFDIQKAISTFYQKKDIGAETTINSSGISEQRFIVLKMPDLNFDDWKNIPVKKVGSKLIYLSEIASFEKKAVSASSYFRINGESSLNITLVAAANQNQIKLSELVRNEVESIKKSLPSDVSLMVEFDRSEYLSKEIGKNTQRTLMATGILLLFVVLTSLSLRYMIVILLSLIANLFIAFGLYHLMGLGIHLYSLAGITLSFGMIIDNTIVMADHLKHRGDRRVFLALLASTLTTIAALSAVWFMPDQYRLNLIDFSSVVIINLIVSLFVALGLIPALIHFIPIQRKRATSSKSIKRARRAIRITHYYTVFLRFFIRRKWILYTLLILGFGLPLFLIPNSIKGDGYWIKKYNATLGNEKVVAVKNAISPFLSGSLGVFVKNANDKGVEREPQRTMLQIDGSMPDGATMEQMNEVMLGFERFLKKFPQIDQFVANIYGPQSANIEITFKPQYEKGSFPHILKSQCEEMSINLGSADWYIYGVGEAFNNSFETADQSNCTLTLNGYNFDQLMEYATTLKADLEKQPRVEWVFLNSRKSYMRTMKYEFLLNIDKEKALSFGVASSAASNFLTRAASQENEFLTIPENNRYRSVFLQPSNESSFKKWELFNNPIEQPGRKIIKMKDFAKMDRERTGSAIDKENMVYRINLEFNFIGNYTLQAMVTDAFIRQYSKILPIGYSISSDRRSYQAAQTDNSLKIKLLALIIFIVLLLCAILFESLKQPLAIIAMIPVSFIGLFIVYGGFELKYDLGGYSAFLLISGLTVNSAIYLIDAQNHIRREDSRIKGLRLYMKAFRMKISPILLTIFSTVLGFVPFLWNGSSETFWFSLAVGTIGGLVFSIFAITIVLPIITIAKKHCRKKLKIVQHEA